MSLADNNQVSTISTVDTSLSVLCSAAASVGFVHTLLGPDHYVPFVAMSRAGRWSLRRTMFVTLLCGLGHVLSSALLGAVGIAVGISVIRLETIEGSRGDLAGWLLLAFGALYTAWGLRRAAKNRPHTHWHAHENGTVHSHEHAHHAEHVHVHEPVRSMTPWVLFTIFVFGPCEPLIPLLMYPAAQGHPSHIVWVTLIFAVTTLATMSGVVFLMVQGVSFVRAAALERYSHALAGVAVTLCGAAVKLGL